MFFDNFSKANGTGFQKNIRKKFENVSMTTGEDFLEELRNISIFYCFFGAFTSIQDQQNYEFYTVF